MPFRLSISCMAAGLLLGACTDRAWPESRGEGLVAETSDATDSLTTGPTASATVTGPPPTASTGEPEPTSRQRSSILCRIVMGREPSAATCTIARTMGTPLAPMMAAEAPEVMESMTGVPIDAGKVRLEGMSSGRPFGRLLRLQERKDVERPMMNGVGANNSWNG